MGTEQTTPFAYCGTDNSYDNDIEKHEQTTLKGDHSTNKKPQDPQLLQQQLNDARHQIKEMFERYAIIKKENDKRYAKLTEEYQRECDQKTKLMTQIQNSKKRYDELIHLIHEEHAIELKKCKTLHIETIETTPNQYAIKQINTLKEYNKQLHEELLQYNQYKNRSLSLQKENKHLLHKLSHLTQIMQQSKANGDNNSNTAQYKEITGLKQNNNLLKKQIDVMQNEMNALKTEYNVSASYGEVDDDDVDITEQLLNHRQNEQIQIAQNKQRQKIETMKKELHDTSKEINALIDANKGANINYRKLSEQYQKECEQSAVFMNQIQDSRQRYIELMNTQKVLNEEYEAVIQKYRMSNIKLQKEMNEYMQYKQQNVELLNTKKELEDEITQLTHIISEHKANDETNRNIIEIKQANESLQKEIEEYKKHDNVIAALNEQISALNREIDAKNNELLQLQTKLDENEDNLSENTVNFSTLTQLFSIDTNGSDVSPVSPFFANNITTPICVQTPQSICNSLDNNMLYDSDNNNVVDNNDDNRETHKKQSGSVRTRSFSSFSIRSASIRSDEKAVNEDRVLNNVKHAKKASNVQTFVRDRYRSMDLGKNKMTDTECESDESSYSEHEALEIAKRKDIAQETLAMKQAILNMKQSMSKEMQKEFRAQRNSMQALVDDDGNINNNNNERGSDDTESVLSSDTDKNKEVNDERLPDSLGPNLFRFRSDAQWNQSDVTQQKKEMSQHMVYLLQSQSNKSHNLIASPKDDEMMINNSDAEADGGDSANRQ